MRMYLVGGAVRDELLGVASKDHDFSVVLEESDLRRRRPARMDEPYTPVDPFNLMVEKLKDLDFKIFLETPEYLTVRAQFPKHIISDSGFVSTTPNLTADFVLARKESDYTDGRRPDVVEPGTLEDDLARRDFSMNAIAKDADGSYIDPFNGQQDIADRIIRAVGDPYERLTEDALRALRAVRFAVTKGFSIESELAEAMQDDVVLDAIQFKISDERIREELNKMFAHSTLDSLSILSEFRLLTEAIFSGRVSLMATMKERK